HRQPALRRDHRQLRQRRHGRPHRRVRGGGQGGRMPGQMRRPHRRSAGQGRRRSTDHRRPRQRRADGRRDDRPGTYRTHLRAGALHLCRQARPEDSRRRRTRRCRADDADPAGPAGAGRDERTLDRRAESRPIAGSGKRILAARRLPTTALKLPARFLCILRRLSNLRFVHHMPRILLAFALTCLLGPVVADERTEARQQIEAARKDVAELQKLLKQIEQEKSAVHKQLKTTESEMGELEKQVDSLQQEIDRSEAELERLDEEKTTLEGARIEQQRLIGIQARAAYQSGRQEYLKLLLNQQNPEKFSRTLTYYDYLNTARFEQVERFNETLRQLANVEAGIESQQTILAEKQDGLKQRRAQLA